ncbi:MAG: DUF2293 domain-containing protein [candidate division KSB1 bacterium]|nr:DUF2293 domain-containing protein [candidate division KSB1 bacterium]MDZ7300782.1 DUF2293 domain-containing protein [candidate division KSB1 bacterium]MDZ7309947.1 DUF2293 domain-containing protein [candidate division KSB1 bacterium]
MQTQAQESNDLVVFMIRRESRCAECGEELWPGRFITLEKKGALCLSCADLDHLEYLPAGDAALTRRATKYSRIHAKVLRWSRTRKRYERQGILVETEALEKAEEECLADAEARERRRQREAEKREIIDQQYVAEFAKHILEIFPKCPIDTAEKIAQHACKKYSGRVGRSAMAKEFDPQAILLAVRAHVRHQYTNYDELLSRGYGRHDARAVVDNKVERILDKWREEET